MKNKHTLILFIVLAILFAGSCSTSKEEMGVPQTRNYKAIVADSVVFEWLSELDLLDYNEETEELLLLDKTSNEVLIINEEGELLSQFNPHIEGPNYVGDYDFGWIFYGNDYLICYGTYYFHLLDKEGKRVKRFPYPVETNGLWMLDYNPRMLFDYEYQGDDKFVAFITAPQGPSYPSMDYYDSIEMVYAIDVESESGYSIMSKPESSTYRNLKGYVDHGWPYMTNYFGSKFAQIHSIDSMLYIWNAEGDELLNSIVIPKEFQPDYEVKSSGDSGKPDRFRINSNVYSTKDYILLHSLKIVPESIKSELRNKYPRYWESEEYREAVQKYMDANYLVFNEEGFLGELKYETGPTGVNRLSTKKDFIWKDRRYEDERDYRTFLKVKIVPVKE